MAELQKRNNNRNVVQSNSYLNNSNGVYGVPPQDVKLEMVVLGQLILEKEAFGEVEAFLLEEHFFKETHQAIFRAISDLHVLSEPIDIITVTERLRAENKLQEIGGPGYIVDLTSYVNSHANLEYHARILQEYYFKRKHLEHYYNQIKRVFGGDDIFDIMETDGQFMYNIESQLHSQEVVNIYETLKETVLRLSVPSTKTITGVQTHIRALDEAMAGLQNDYIILAARPGMGKTDLLITLCYNVAMLGGEAVLIFSLEMSKEEIIKRICTIHFNFLTKDKIKRGNITQEEIDRLHKELQPLLHAKIYIDDTAGITINEMRAKARKLKKKHNIRMVGIDYLQLITTPNNENNSNKGFFSNRDQQLGHISRQLLAMKKELKLPVIALSQLGRRVETRTDKRPLLSDLRESGNLEQDADIVASLYRPAYYKESLSTYSQNEGLEFEITEDFTEFEFLKFRDGNVGRWPLSFKGYTSRVTDYNMFSNFEAIDDKSLPETKHDPFGGAKGSLAEDGYNDLENNPPF